MRSLLPGLAPFLLGLAVVGCSFSSTEPPAPPADGEVAFDGHVTFVTVAGGAWVLRSEAGVLYEPINLQAPFHQEGLPVRVRALVREDMASIRMVGPIIEIRHIARR